MIIQWYQLLIQDNLSLMGFNKYYYIIIFLIFLLIYKFKMSIKVFKSKIFNFKNINLRMWINHAWQEFWFGINVIINSLKKSVTQITLCCTQILPARSTAFLLMTENSNFYNLNLGLTPNVRGGYVGVRGLPIVSGWG